MLGRPHLMLPDLGRNDRVAARRLRRLVQVADGALRHDLGTGLYIIEAAAGAPSLDPRPPFGEVGPDMAAGAKAIEDRLNCQTGISDDRQININSLVDRTAIDIDVDFFGLGRERIEASSHPVVEARAEADDQVRLVHRQIGFIGAVHAQHAEPLVRRRREGAQAHERGRNRATDPIRQFAQQYAGLRTAVDDAATCIEDWALCGRDHFDRFGYGSGIGLFSRAIAFMRDQLGLFIRRGRDLDIFRDVDDDRTRASGWWRYERPRKRRPPVCRGLSPDNYAWNNGA